MKILLLLVLVFNPISDLDKIARVNAAKKEAERAYLAEDYELARQTYLFLKDSLGVSDDKLMLNLANAQFHSSDSANALANYRNLMQSSDRQIASLANQQLGALEFSNQKYQEALQYYKSALKSNPGNEDARYNYELLKKLIKEQEEQQEQQQENQDQENQDQENQDQEQQDQQNQEQQEQEQNQEQQDQEQQEEQQQEEQEENQQEEQQQEEQKPEDQQEQEKEDQSKPNPIDEEKLKEMKISEEKAMLILEAMKNNEIQYIQQNQRKAKKKKDPSKPDW